MFSCQTGFVSFNLEPFLSVFGVHDFDLWEKTGWLSRGMSLRVGLSDASSPLRTLGRNIPEVAFCPSPYVVSGGPWGQFVPCLVILASISGVRRDLSSSSHLVSFLRGDRLRPCGRLSSVSTVGLSGPR